MDRPPPDPAKLLSAWMEWERGDTPPGRVMSNLKTGGLRELLEGLAAQEPVAAGESVSTSASGSEGADAAGGGAPSAEDWTPVV
ncbi:MAG TPA: hypothetical protein VFZ97_01310 [Acidimicrobiales bacterium]